MGWGLGAASPWTCLKHQHWHPHVNCKDTPLALGITTHGRGHFLGRTICHIISIPLPWLRALEGGGGEGSYTYIDSTLPLPAYGPIFVCAPSAFILIQDDYGTSKNRPQRMVAWANVKLDHTLAMWRVWQGIR